MEDEYEYELKLKKSSISLDTPMDGDKKEKKGCC